VSRHDVVRTASDPAAPLQVGNGRLAFGADITGLQTFLPFATMSDWGWHDAPLPPGQAPADFEGQVWDTHGRPVRYGMPDPAHPAISQWLISSPKGLPGGGTKVPLPYFPGSGGLLYAAAFLAAGWDGAPGRGRPDSRTTVPGPSAARALSPAIWAPRRLRAGREAEQRPAAAGGPLPRRGDGADDDRVEVMPFQ
jgi:hypothetical protein